mmetsp:Transcript_5655/g.12561  ORF Transcript_5655/g.12561 Transcript_5655/m.12561 type:complete len:87 (+) Transcript_5655:177-437(+)
MVPLSRCGVPFTQGILNMFVGSSPSHLPHHSPFMIPRQYTLLLLALKVFLLERFLHDILFESSNPQILRDFVGVTSSEASKLNTKG